MILPNKAISLPCRQGRLGRTGSMNWHCAYLTQPSHLNNACTDYITLKSHLISLSIQLLQARRDAFWVAFSAPFLCSRRRSNVKINKYNQHACMSITHQLESQLPSVHPSICVCIINCDCDDSDCATRSLLV